MKHPITSPPITKAIIPVAGKGVRLHPHTFSIQKALLPVAGRSILDHVIEPLAEAGIQEFCFIIGHLGDQVRAHVGDHPGIKSTFVDQGEQLGLGHAVRLGLEDEDKPAVIVLSDTILKLNYHKFLHHDSNIIGVVEVDDPRRFGIVQVRGDRIIDLVEKPDASPSNLAIAGIYRIASQKVLKEALETLIAANKRTKGEYQLTDALSLMLGDGERFEIQRIDQCLDCGVAEGILATNKLLLEDGSGNAVHPSSIIEKTSLETTTVMENCIIENSEIKGCIILAGAHLVNCKLHDQIVEGNAVLRDVERTPATPVTDL